MYFIEHSKDHHLNCALQVHYQINAALARAWESLWGEERQALWHCCPLRALRAVSLGMWVPFRSAPCCSLVFLKQGVNDLQVDTWHRCLVPHLSTNLLESSEYLLHLPIPFRANISPFQDTVAALLCLHPESPPAGMGQMRISSPSSSPKLSWTRCCLTSMFPESKTSVPLSSHRFQRQVGLHNIWKIMVSQNVFLHLRRKRNEVTGDRSTDRMTS